MRKLALAVAGGLFLLLGSVATPAYADCAKDIKDLEKQLSLVQETGRGNRKVKAEQFVAEAKQALADGKAKVCEKKVKIANKLLSEVGR